MIPIEVEEKGPLLVLKTIIARTLGSIGSKEYRSLFIDRKDGSEDVIYEGEYACAYHSSTPFHAFGLLNAVHTTVDGMEAELKSSADWIKFSYPLPGAVGILERKEHLDGHLGTRHTFICVAAEECVHNDPTPGIRSPQLERIADFTHHTGRSRQVEQYFVHKRILAEQ